MQNFYDNFLDRVMAEINYDINLLYVTPCVYTRNMVLNHLRDRISIFESMMQTKAIPAVSLPASPHQALPANQVTMTLEELAEFNGKNGKPAYVAVNGMIYDVTNNAAWAAATHFGLTAGRDLTSEFASCHADQQILSQLKLIGKLV